jgi:hypothetical protein
MVADDLLRGYTIADPCPMDWAQMRGDERSRFCGACSQHVYDLTVLSSDEAAALVCSQNGPTCVRLYRHGDGRLAPFACPNAAQLRSGPWQFTIRCVMAVIAGAAGALGVGRLMADYASQSRRTLGRIAPISAPASGPGNGPSSGVPVQPDTCPESGEMLGDVQH